MKIHGLDKFLPILGWLPNYQRDWFRFDLVAGITAAAVVIPKAMAYATIAGLPVETGLYTALIPMVIYAILGSSRMLSFSATSTIAILVAGELLMLAEDGITATPIAVASTLAFLVGVFLLLAGIFRLGFIANFISDPVLTGFKAGLGMVIIVDQAPKLLGIHFDKGRFLENILSIFRHMPETNVATLVLALATLALMFGLERFRPHSPAPLFAVLLGIVSSWLLLPASAGVELVGRIPAGLPAPVLPDLSLIGKLWPGAMGIALMTYTESIAAGRAFARHGDRRPDPNRELTAIGAANLAGSFFQAFPAGGGTSQTAVNDKAGARSQLAELVTAGIVLATLLFLYPVIGIMPQATLAAVVIATTVELVSPAEFRVILRVRSTEFWWSVTAFVGVVAFGTLRGILVAVAVSVLTLFYQANRPPVYAVGRKRGSSVFRPQLGQHPDDETIPGLLIIRTEGRMTFASAPQVGERMWELIREAGPRVVILECSAIPDLEYTALRALTGFEERLAESGITLWLVALNPEALKVVERSPLGRKLGHGRMFFDLPHAVDAYLSGKGGKTSAGE